MPQAPGRKKAAIFLGSMAILFVGIQLVPYGRDHQNPARRAEPPWNTPRTRELFFRACADCHSNETVWPWYSHVAPVSWLVARDVAKGRREMNLSAWRPGKDKGEEAAKEILEGNMPLKPYLLAHAAARLSIQEKQDLADGLVQTLASFRQEDGGKERGNKRNENERENHREERDHPH